MFFGAGFRAPKPDDENPYNPGDEKTQRIRKLSKMIEEGFDFLRRTSQKKKRRA